MKEEGGSSQWRSRGENMKKNWRLISLQKHGTQMNLNFFLMSCLNKSLKFNLIEKKNKIFFITEFYLLFFLLLLCQVENPIEIFVDGAS